MASNPVSLSYEEVDNSTVTNSSAIPTSQRLRHTPYFCPENKNPYDMVEWRTTRITLKDKDGHIIYDQQDVEAPADWSERAIRIAAQKYFYGKPPHREHSVRQLVGRVTGKIDQWLKEQNYFQTPEDRRAYINDLTWLLLTQHGAFNSPVWFNLGIEARKQQCSACFISSVEDTMESISELQQTEAKIFRLGSGNGVNLSKLRGSMESLSNGGVASGPVSFMRGYDAWAGTIKSGGACLLPTQRVYTNEGPVSVADLAKKSHFYVLSYDPPQGRYAIKRATAAYTGRKKAVRVRTDKGVFEVSSDHPFRKSLGEYVRADALTPGTSLFRCSVDNSHGYIRVHLRNEKKGKEVIHRMVAQDVLGVNLQGKVVHHKDGDSRNNCIENLEITTQEKHARRHSNYKVDEGVHIFQRQTFPKPGSTNPMHKSSEFWKDEERVVEYKQKQRDLMPPTRAREMQKLAAQQRIINTAYQVLDIGGSLETFEDYYEGRKRLTRCVEWRKNIRKRIERHFDSYENFRDTVYNSNHCVVSIEPIGTHPVYHVSVDCPTADDKSPQTGHNFVIWPNGEHTGSGVVVANTRRAARIVILNADHPDILDFITCKREEEEKAHALIAAGFAADFNDPKGAYGSVQFQNANHSVRVTDAFMERLEHALAHPDEEVLWELISPTDGTTVLSKVDIRVLWKELCKAAWACGDPGLQFDTTTNAWHTTPVRGRIHGSNPCCFRGDTRVETSEGRIPIQKLAETAAQGRPLPHALTYDFEAQLSVTRPIKHAWEAGTTNTLLNVRTKSGASFQCTPEHRFYLHDGTPVEARTLESGQLLRSLSPQDRHDSVSSIELVILETPVAVYDLEVEGLHTFGIADEGLEHALVVSNSEFVYLDDTACNLASLNLMKFRQNDGAFNYDKMRQAAHTFIIAMDAVVSKAYYPVEEISENSAKFRPLGLGYANLGAYLMSIGLPYNSGEGRRHAREITSTLTAHAYATSATLAEHLGPFAEFSKNSSAMLRVIEKHRYAAVEESLASAVLWDETLDRGQKWGFRNAQVTLMAPSGTIGLLMDCDTTGIEPEIGLYKVKQLVGGGDMILENRIVDMALSYLGYDAGDIHLTKVYLEKNKTLEGCPVLLKEHLPVFDCAIAGVGTRSLSLDAHIKMTAAVQPFISGAVSKTCNLPTEATVEDVSQAFQKAWALGIKNITIYRDGCKKSQPYNMKKKEEATPTPAPTSTPEVPKAVRRRLSDHQTNAHRIKFRFGEVKGYLIVTPYEDTGMPGEVFVEWSKEGSTISGLVDGWAQSISYNLQYGVPLETLVSKFSHTKFEPSGWSSDPDIRHASSIYDALMRKLAAVFLDRRVANGSLAEVIEVPTQVPSPDTTLSPQKTHDPVTTPPVSSAGNGNRQSQSQFFIDAPPCLVCGALMQRSGATCYSCDYCGATTGCGG